MVVACCWSSSPDSAITNVPMQAAVIKAPWRSHRRSTSVASRTSGRPRAVSSGPGILNPIAGTTTQSGARAPTGCTGTVRPCAVRTALRTATVRTSNFGTARADISISSFAV